MNLTQIREAPWFVTSHKLSEDSPTEFFDVVTGPVDDPSEQYSVIDNPTKDEAELIAKARNALDVMLRLGWSPSFDPYTKLWTVFSRKDRFGVSEEIGAEEGLHYTDPFTALVEVEKWYKENIDPKEK